MNNNRIIFDDRYNWSTNNICKLQVYSPNSVLYNRDYRIKEVVSDNQVVEFIRRILTPLDYFLVVFQEYQDNLERTITTDRYNLLNKVTGQFNLIQGSTIYVSNYLGYSKNLAEFPDLYSVIEVQYINPEYKLIYHPLYSNELDYLRTGNPIYFKNDMSEGYEFLYNRYKAYL